MIPFFQFNTILIGSLTIQVWGLMVAIGIIASVLLATKMAKRYFLSEDALLDAAIWMLISAFVFARLFHVFFYNLDYYAANPGDVFKFWLGGESSLGGFFGAFLAFYIFVKIRKFKMKEIWPYLDIMSLSLWLGWGIGRIGCFLIHDHPGIASNIFLAVNFPNGSRLDLGLLESILGFALFAIFAILFKRLIKKRWGLVTIYSFLSYAVARFFLDFLRATDLQGSDIRYAFMTPAQWGMIFMVIALTVVLVSVKLRRPPAEIS